MKNILFVLFAMVWGSSQQVSPSIATTPESRTADLISIWDGVFSAADAEQILGEKAQLIDSLDAVTENIPTYKSAYQALSEDEASGKTGVLYFMAEQYPTSVAAHTVYADILQANSGHTGIERLQGLGDEAYFHSDGVNFYFLLVRKGDKLFRMKVNKLTSHTDRAQFTAVAEKVNRALP